MKTQTKYLFQFTELSRRRLLKTGNDHDNKRVTGEFSLCRAYLRIRKNVKFQTNNSKEYHARSGLGKQNVDSKEVY